MPEERQTISSARLAAGEVARHSFLTVRRGFDPKEVRSFLEVVARELSVWEQRELDLRRQLSEAEHRARNPVLDEATLSAALGQQSAQVLRSAHEEAARIVRQSEENAATLLHDAQRQANDAQIQAEAAAAERIAEAELSAAAIDQQVRQQTEAQQASAHADAEALVAQARTQGRDMLEQAQAARKRVLADLANRRHAMHIQIEQFRAARDELAAAVVGVRDSVDRIVDDLARADDSARAAAAEVVRGPLPAPEVAPEEHGPLGAPDAVPGAPVVLTPSAAPGSPEDPDVGGGVVIVEEVDVVPEAPPPAVGGSDPGTPVHADPMTGGDAPSTGFGGGDRPHPRSELGSVDELFARIRSSRAVSATDAEAPAGSQTDAAPPAADQTGTAPSTGHQTEAVPPMPSDVEPETAGSGAGDTPAGPGAGDTPAGPGAGAAPAGPGAGAAPAGPGAGAAPAGDSGGTDVDAALLEARSSLLGPVSATLSRRLKRALQDDQNHLLDRIRSGSSRAEALVPADEQRAVFSDAAVSHLVDAFDSGVAFARQHGVAGAEPKGEPAALPLSNEMAGTIVAQLRRRLDPGGGSGPDDAGERVGAAYREWRGERIERLVGDYAVAAFSAGVIDAGAEGIRWVVAGDDASCADCEDNSLAGVIRAGEAFPTGHRHPPAHPGCRCLVAPMPT